MAVASYPNGLGGSTGDTLVTSSPLEVNGDVWYVDSNTGADASGDAGQNRNYPLATLSQAVTNCADGDIIVCMDGHTETLTSALSIDQDVIIVGEGSNSGKPTVKFTINAASSALFTLAGGANSYIGLRNIWIEENAQSNSVGKLVTDGTLNYLFMDGVYVECNGNDTVVALAADVDTVFSMRNCTWISTSTYNSETDTRPNAAVANYSPVLLIMKGNVFSGGVVGWSQHFVMYPASGGPTVIWAEENSLLLGADIQLTESTVGHAGFTTNTGSARIEWCDIADPA